MRYEMDRSGIGKMMRSSPGINQATRQAAQKTLAIARSRINTKTTRMASSGRVENAGIQPVYKGEPRITWRVVFYDPGAEAYDRKSGFLSGAIGRRVR
jgi:hypothetical protein